MSTHESEVARGERFEFGANWRRFLDRVSPHRIETARRSLATMLDVETLAGVSFLDVGSGSGLFSLAARRLGARVRSFDYDPQSVAATRALKERFFAGDPEWTIEDGSVLDRAYLEALGSFDVVYAWGVLHHTGALWQAMDNAAISVAPGGRLFVAIYNHQRIWTPVHTALKRAYARAPRPARWMLAGSSIAYYVSRGLVKDLVLLRNPLARYRNYDDRSRGMSWWHDQLDWIGGYPFETATPEAVFAFYHKRGFALVRMTTCGGDRGCNQFVFRRERA
ncbi:MAG: methyltransferase [Pirellulales bacterium]